MGTAPSSLRVHSALRRGFRDWDVLDVHVVKKKYHAMTLRYCVTLQQLAHVLGRLLPDPLVSLCFDTFAPAKIRATPAVAVVDMMEVLVCLVLVCQATLPQRVAFLFEMMDSRNTGRLSSSDLFLLFQAVARSIVKMTHTAPGLAMPSDLQKLIHAGMAADPARQDTVDKCTFCTWILENPGLRAYLQACTGEDRPRLYLAMEKSSSIVGYIEFDSVHHLRSISVDCIRAMAEEQLAALPATYVFLSHGRPIPVAREADVKAWDIVPFATLGTPGHHWRGRQEAYSTQARRDPLSDASVPHPNQARPLLAFQFQYHHYTLPSDVKRVDDIAPMCKHVRFELHGRETTLWRLAQYWCGDWLLNQSALQHPNRAMLLQRLRKRTKPLVVAGGSSGLVVKDTQGCILSHNPRFAALQSKLRLLAMETQMATDGVAAAPFHPPTILVERHAHPARYYSRLLGTQRTTPATGEWHVLTGQAVLGSWCQKRSAVPLQPDEVEVFPVLWLRGAPAPVPRPLELPVSKTESHVDLLRALVPALPDKRVLNAQDCCGRTLLHYAALFGHAKLMETLLAETVLLNVPDAQRNTPLHLAAMHGRLKAATRLLAYGAAPTALNVHHQLPLHVALYCVTKRYDITTGIFARYETEEQVVDLLWDRTPPAWWHAPDAYGHSVHSLEMSIFGSVFEAARAGLVPRIQHLLEAKKIPHVNVRLDALQTTALIEATERGRYNVVDYLVRQGADVFLQNTRGATALHKAAARGFERIAECLLYKYPRVIAVQDANGKTALHIALEHGHTAIALLICQYMLGHEHRAADVYGQTPLHVACVLGNVVVARVLLVKIAVESGAPTMPPTPPAVQRRGHMLARFLKKPCSDRIATPMEMLIHGWAVATAGATAKATYGEMHHRFLELFQVLLEAAGARPPAGISHLVLAKLAHAPSVVVQCLELLAHHKHFAVEAVDTSGNTLLLAEVRRRCIDRNPCLAVVRALLDLGANGELGNRLGERAIPCAAFYAHDSLLELLLDAAPFDAIAADGTAADSALHMACLRGHLSTVKLLVARGATVHACVADESPLCFAVRSGNLALVQYLVSCGADVNLWLPLPSKRVFFGVTFDSSVVGHGGPLSLVLHAAPALFQERSYDYAMPRAVADRIHAVHRTYSTPKERAKREQWQTQYRIAELIVGQLLLVDPALKLHVTADDVTQACAVGFWSVVSSLLLHRRIPFPPASIPSPSVQAIHLAAAAGQATVVGLLVSNGVDPNALVVRSRWLLAAPLYFAFVHGQYTTVAKLYLVGATTTTVLRREGAPAVEHLVRSHSNAWMKMALLGRWQLVEPVYASMVDHLRLGTASALSVVHIACYRGALPLLVVYHAAGLPLHDVAPSGHTSLTLAVRHGHVDVVAWLLQTAPALQAMRAPQLPLTTAARLPASSPSKAVLLDLLLAPASGESAADHAIRVGAIDSRGCSALDYAALASDASAVTRLLPHGPPTLATVIAALTGDWPHRVLAPLLAAWTSLAGATFDHILQVCILASSQGVWEALERLLAMPEAPLQPFATWIHRAASCCLVLHRAAAANHSAIVAKLVGAYGVPPDLVVATTAARTPLWYAAAHMALDAFLVLVLALPPTTSFLPALVLRGADAAVAHGRCRPHRMPTGRLAGRVCALNALFWPLHSVEASDALRVSGVETCMWRNLSALSDYGTPALHQLRVVHKLCQLWAAHTLRHPLNEPNDTLLHLTVAAQDAATVAALVAAGAALDTVNNAGDSPWTLAARRNDASSARVVQLVWPRLSVAQKEAVVKAATATATINMATLVFLLRDAIPVEPVPGNLLSLPGHAYYAAAITAHATGAIQLLLEAKVPLEHRSVWPAVEAALARPLPSACALLELLLPQLPPSTPLEVVGDLTRLAAQQQWYNVVLHLLQAFHLPLVRQLALCLAPGTAQSVLHLAVAHGQATVVQRLLQHDIAVTPDHRGQTALHLIAHLGDGGLLQLWQRVAPGTLQAALDAPDAAGNTAFHLAAARGHMHIVEALQHSGSAAGNRRNARGWTPILVAAKSNHLPVVVRLLLQQPAPDCLVTLENVSIVIVAAAAGHFKLVGWLLATLAWPAATVQQLRSTDGRTLVHFAALFNAIELLTTTPALEALVQTPDDHGCQPVHYALMLGHLSVVEFLCARGADVQSPIQTRLTDEPLVVAHLFGWCPLPGWFRHAVVHNATAATGAWRPAKGGLAAWDPRKASLLEAAARLGLDATVGLVVGLLPHLPQLCDGSLETRKRIFMLAVALNHVAIVDCLCLCNVTHQLDKSHYFRDFIEAAVQHSASRGLERMTLSLIQHWHAFPAPGARALATATPAEFAFQFATVLQQACIYGRLELVEYLVARGGDAILGYRVDEGPALVYAFAFGQREVVALLCKHGAEVSALDGYFAPSIKLWIEYKEHPLLQNEWYERLTAAPRQRLPRRRPFTGPLETYARDDERLPIEVLQAAFGTKD
ncbi:hypothetical protein ACHHYP_07521 [Achlya hypogyna]|uniref:Calmodulin n=1 Tax=Achlya hypogyna TaxID=1202772 RepID=A0A1V9YQW0_ACHHY|nr:hypothetical protein ACHHYP_07521 [Achlya hypogyna]